MLLVGVTVWESPTHAISTNPGDIINGLLKLGKTLTDLAYTTASPLVGLDKFLPVQLFKLLSTILSGLLLLLFSMFSRRIRFLGSLILFLAFFLSLFGLLAYFIKPT